MWMIRYHSSVGSVEIDVCDAVDVDEVEGVDGVEEVDIVLVVVRRMLLVMKISRGMLGDLRPVEPWKRSA